MNAILEKVRAVVKDDDLALGVGLSLVNIGSMSPSVMQAAGRLIAELGPDSAAPDGPLPGGRFLKALRGAELDPAQRLDLLGDYLDLTADDPNYTMSQFLADVFGEEGEEPSAAEPEPDPAPAPEPEPAKDLVVLTASVPPKVNGYVAALHDDVAAEAVGADSAAVIEATVVIHEESFLEEVVALDRPTDVYAHAPWWLEYPIGSQLQFNIDLRADDDGPYVDVFLSDPARRRIYADWPRLESPFGVYEQVVEGRSVKVRVEPTDVPVAPFVPA